MREDMYLWRKMTSEQREETLRLRRVERRPWHSPPHRDSEAGRYLLTAACYEHKPHIGTSAGRMAAFECELIDLCRTFASELWAWVILPNHYHVLLHTERLRDLLAAVGKLHGRTSRQWNGEEITRGRQVWCGAAETTMKSDGHFWATVNYVHHNPVKHGYVERWQDWPYGNAREYLEGVGPEEARRVWREYPLNKYGEGWDD
jgi:putative transposase